MHNTPLQNSSIKYYTVTRQNSSNCHHDCVFLSITDPYPLMMMTAIGLIVLSILLDVYLATALCNRTYPCFVRNEFATELHYLRGSKKCADVYRFDCICKQPIDVLYNEVPPYIFKDETNVTVGIIPGNRVNSVLLPDLPTLTHALFYRSSSFQVLP